MKERRQLSTLNCLSAQCNEQLAGFCALCTASTPGLQTQLHELQSLDLADGGGDSVYRYCGRKNYVNKFSSVC